jgi:hypothetical protein
VADSHTGQGGLHLCQLSLRGSSDPDEQRDKDEESIIKQTQKANALITAINVSSACQ